MTAECTPVSRFKIKWGNVEVEYIGEKSAELFREVFDHIKILPNKEIQAVENNTIEPELNNQNSAPITTPDNILGGKAYDFITKDTQQSFDKIINIIKFENRAEFPELVPFLHSHPTKLEDAIVLISYAIQVGLQKSPLDVVYIKNVLKGVNGYPLTGNEFGVALGILRKKNYVAASQNKGQYKPFTLIKEGIERARVLLNS